MKTGTIVALSLIGIASTLGYIFVVRPYLKERKARGLIKSTYQPVEARTTVEKAGDISLAN